MKIILKALYLHGLHSTGLTQEKREVLETYDIKVDAPIIDYSSKDVEFFEKMVESYKPEMLIGSSMGGRMAYYLSNKYQLPAVLFNPAIGNETCEKLIPIPDYLNENRFKQQLFVFGEFDDVVISSDVLQKVGYEVDFLTIEDMTHIVTPENIDTAMFYFFDTIFLNQ